MAVVSNKFRFGPYEVRTRTRELYKFGTKLKLRPQPFQVLRILLDRAGDVVTRDELRQMLWPAETFVDFEHGLNTSVKELRRVLSDSASEPRYIETLPKLGYRFIAAVEAEGVAPPVELRSPPPETAPATSDVRPQPSWRRMWIVYLVLLSAVLVASLAAWMAVERRAEPQNSAPVQLTGLPGSEQSATWSPDGRQVAFTWNGENEDKFDIYLVQPGSTQTLRLTTLPEDNHNPAWSPDGRWIAFINEDSQRYSLNLVSPLGGPVRKLVSNAGPLGRISWLPDSRVLVLEIEAAPKKPVELWAVWVDSGEHRTITFPPSGIPGDTAPAVSPDGKMLAFCRTTAWHTSELYLLDLSPDLSPASPARRLTNLGFVGWPAWTPDGSQILFSADQGNVGIWEIERGGGGLHPVLGVPDTAQQPALANRPGGYTSLIFSNSTSNVKIKRYDAEHPQSPPVELAPSSRAQGCPRYSPDGTKLAFNSDRTGYPEIWIANADGSHVVQLTNLHHRITEEADWSPSGEEIAFVSQQVADRQIYVMRASGGTPEPITNEKGIVGGGGWSRDGSGYYYTSMRSGRAEVWKAPREGGRPQQMTTEGGTCGFESAGGFFHYWQGERGYAATLFRRTPGGDEPVTLPDRAFTCGSSPTAKGFYYVSAPDGDVYRYDEALKVAVRVLARPEFGFVWFSASPDGRWLAFNSKVKPGNDLMIMEHFR